MSDWWFKGTVLVLLLALVVWMAWNFSTVIDRAFVFFPDRRVTRTPAQVGLGYRDLWIKTPDGEHLHGWLVVATSAAPLLIFCHGNAGNIGDRVGNVASLEKAGISVLIFDYRGYGKSSGHPSEEGIYTDALATYHYAVEVLGYSPDGVVLFGRSLGAAVAADLALRVPVAGIILESAFTNLKDLAWVHYPFIPGKFLVKHKFNVLEVVRGIEAPLLVVHGDQDGLVPMRLGKKVYQAAPGAKEFYVIPGAGHNDTELVGGEAYILRLRSFVYEVTGRKG
jgi:fermentation-respiration switch protein FrsA (DUF1100 family)